MVAPRHLRTTLKRLVDREAAHARAGRRAHIVIKVNAVTDDAMIRALYRASQAGVTIDLLVRGICSLRPGVPGISERIRVRSIVGRFLEHSRVYWFANGGAEEMFIGSADVMERNLGRRVETLIPMRDERLLRHVRDVVLDAYLKDTDRAMALDATGAYSRVPAGARRPLQRPGIPAALLHARPPLSVRRGHSHAARRTTSTASDAASATTAPNQGKIYERRDEQQRDHGHERGRADRPRQREADARRAGGRR